jgi:hypothetical protein
MGHCFVILLLTVRGDELGDSDKATNNELAIDELAKDELANDDPAANVQKKSGSNNIVCLGYTAATANTFEYPSYGTATMLAKRMPATPVSIRDALHPSGLLFHVVDGVSSPFAAIDMKTARFLKGALKESGVSGRNTLLDMFQARLVKRKCEDVDSQLEPRDEWKASLRMTIHVNIPECIATAVRDIARQHRIVLQPPMLNSYPDFENPTRAVAKMDVEEEKGPELIRQNSLYDDTVDARRISDHVERNALNLAKLFASADNLQEADQPKGVKTAMLSHQRQGLHFLLEHERDAFDADEDMPKGPIDLDEDMPKDPIDPDEDTPKGVVQCPRIWEKTQNIDDKTNPYYTNLVLGIQSSPS